MPWFLLSPGGAHASDSSDDANAVDASNAGNASDAAHGPDASHGRVSANAADA